MRNRGMGTPAAPSMLGKATGVIFAHRPANIVMTHEYKRGDQFVYRLVAGEHLLVALRGDRVAPLFVLTPTAAQLWEQLAVWRSAEFLVEHLTLSFDVEASRASADVNEFLEQLSSLGAVEQREINT